MNIFEQLTIWLSVLAILLSITSLWITLYQNKKLHQQNKLRDFLENDKTKTSEILIKTNEKIKNLIFYKGIILDGHKIIWNPLLTMTYHQEKRSRVATITVNYIFRKWKILQEEIYTSVFPEEWWELSIFKEKLTLYNYLKLTLDIQPTLTLK